MEGQTMNEQYRSVVKEIDEMLAIREIDEFLDKLAKKKSEKEKEKEFEQIKKVIQKNKKEEWELQLYTKESNKLGCHISIGSGTKEEVFELPKTLEKEVFELYECVGSKTEKQKKMIKINWRKELNLA